ncbi:MJ0042-type zinc finger domain-containing protein [Gimibacter soli]|uniref:DUF3426 domain-containing protein n=1 Tax=Gimibacter soli TaxID=3024400 RepID=A0AAF0BMS1_9PROT|nr:MJ0042-type zinc finger domain-containing protein [Gimibacter soli]WCL54960.1 DUF3426 domain-containing protein [Gimibacter soli]
MILQCPSCDARFKVGAGAIPAAGRKVRCARCMHEWHALPGELKEAPKRPATPPQPRQPEAPRAAEAAPASRPAPDEAETAMAAASSPMDFEDEDTTDAEVVDDPNLPPPGAPVQANNKPLFSADAFAAAMKEAGGEVEERPSLTKEGFASRRKDVPEIRDEYVESDDDEDDFLARRRAEQRRQSEVDRAGRRRRFILFLWVLLFLFWGGLAGAIFLMKDTVKEIWPKSAAIYSWIEGQNDAEALKEKLEAEGKPLSKPITEAVTVLGAFLESSSVEEVNGEQVLMVKGYVENQGARAATVPQVEIRIADGSGQVVDQWVVNPPGQIIARGGKVHFSSPRSPIPAGAASAEVRVLDGTRSTEAADTSNLYERGH